VVGRNVTATAPNRLRVADRPTAAGSLSLTIVLEA
jgi:hypothetical protein